MTAQGDSSADIQNKLQGALDKVDLWCKNNAMTLNAKKSKAMFIYPANKCDIGSVTQLHIGNEAIIISDSEKLLGVQIDRNLNWKDQVTKVIKKCNSQLYLLLRIKCF